MLLGCLLVHENSISAAANKTKNQAQAHTTVSDCLVNG